MNTIATPKNILLIGPEDRLERVIAIAYVQQWSVRVVAEPVDALRALRNDSSMDLIVIAPGPFDQHMELCRGIKLDARHCFVPVIVMLPTDLAGRAEEVFDAGADDCILASAADREVLLRLLRVIRAKEATDSLEDSTAVIMALAGAVEGKDHYTCGHVERVGGYCVAIGRRLGIEGETLTSLRIGGIVHDIGKIGIPDHILNKPGKLTDEEMAVVKRHPIIGEDILKPLRTFRAVLPIVRWHHERPNGTGYPDGLKADQLPVTARITAIADVFDALATDRPYRPAFSLEKCRQIMLDSAGKGELDELILRIFFEIFEESPIPGVRAA